MKRLAYLIAGFISFGLGIIGVILPVLPTIPFLLLAGFCFARSSEKFDTWLHKTQIYEFCVADDAETKSVSAEDKKKFIWQIYLLMGISIFFALIV